MQKTGFKDALAVKEKKGGKSPWNFSAPDYDERSSNFVSAGDNYGVGHRNPIGLEKVKTNYPMPMGYVDTMRVDETR